MMVRVCCAPAQVEGAPRGAAGLPAHLSLSPGTAAALSDGLVHPVLSVRAGDSSPKGPGGPLCAGICPGPQPALTPVGAWCPWVGPRVLWHRGGRDPSSQGGWQSPWAQPERRVQAEAASLTLLHAKCPGRSPATR